MQRVRIGVVVAAVAALLGSGLTTAIGRDKQPGPLAGIADRAEADRLEGIIDWHIWNRQVYEIDYASTLRDPNEVVDPTTAGERYPGVAQITDTSDSALWTGTSLASQGFRYQVAKQNLTKKGLRREERDYWQSQKAGALDRARPLLEQYHLLSNISSSWKAPPPHQPDAPLDPADRDLPELIDTGVSPYQGEEAGLLFRGCIPVDAPDRLTFEKNGDAWQDDTIYGPLHWAPEGRDYYCKDGTSRDAYAGATFGMVTAFDMFDDAELGPSAQPGVSLHEQVGEDLMLLVDFLVRHGWSTPRPHSKISTQNDLSGFWSPLFVYTPGARVHLASIARHAANAIGTPEDKAKFGAIWAEEFHGSSPFEFFGSELDAQDKYSDYYKWNLGHLVAFDLIRLAESRAERDELRQGIGVMDATTKWDDNAHFEAITYAVTGDPARLEKSVEHTRQWRAWRAQFEGATNWWRYNHTRCALPTSDPQYLTCVPQRHVRQVVDTPLGPVTREYEPPPTSEEEFNGPDCENYYPSNCRSLEVIPVAERIPTDFLWQRSPYQLDADRRSPVHESQGIDYLLPYWMLRYLTEVNEPAIEPFPPYAGPYYK